MFEDIISAIAQAAPTSPTLREWLNGSTFPLMACLTTILGYTLAETWITYGRGWTRLDGISTLCALFWVCLAETIRSGFIWLQLWYENEGLSSAFLEPYRSIGLTCSSIMLLAGGLRLVRQITPRRWGRFGVAASVVVIVSFVTITHLQ